MSTRIELDVNDGPVELDVEPRDTLLDVVRERLGLTGAHAGCEHGSCGACTVLFDGEPVRSCLVFAVQCAGRRIETIEAFGRPEQLHPVMDAFRRHHALQCGFCTPAMVLAAIAWLRDVGPAGGREPATNDAATADAVRHALAGNLCRCTGYAGIVEAVLAVAESGAS